MALLMPVIMVQAQENSSTKRAKVVIVTDMGEIEMELYNETPLHRDNFLKLAREGYYNGSIFHRVINQFMIQGGGGADGNSDPGYTVPAEILPAFFHHKGALCAARMPDQVNPKKASSGSQFYIVHGRTFTDQELTAYGARTGKSWTEAQKAEYRTKGGAPHLDGDYTVYGRVTKGMEVVDKIAAVQTGDANRPIKEVKMTVRILQE